MTMDIPIAARLCLQCLDLTSLNDTEDAASMEALCQRAQGPLGPVAAVCVWPQWVALVRARLAPAITVAAVVNFPHGSTDIARAVDEAQRIGQAGGQEVDMVLPYSALTVGKELVCAQLVKAVRRASDGLRLKVILETGELQTTHLIERATQIAIDNGADFIKTSTGKTSQGATPAAALAILGVLARQPPALASRLGFKASGGIRSVAQALTYLELTQTALGAQALSPARFRLGASSLLNDIEALLGGEPGVMPDTGY